MSASRNWGRVGQGMCVLCLKPVRMNETRQHLAAGTECEAPRTSARVTWSQGFPDIRPRISRGPGGGRSETAQA